MKRLLCGFIFVCSSTFNSFGQVDSLIYTLPKPVLKWGLPNGVLISPDNKFFLVCYDYKPSYVDLYQLQGFKKLKAFKIKGFTYFSTSSFLSDNKEVYIDIGRRKAKYILLNLQTGKKQKVKCENSPVCDNGSSSPFRNEKHREYMTSDGSLLFKIEERRVNIYKKGKRSLAIDDKFHWPPEP